MVRFNISRRLLICAPVEEKLNLLSNLLKNKKNDPLCNLIRTQSYIYYEIIRLLNPVKKQTMKTNHLKWLGWSGLALVAITVTAWKRTDNAPQGNPSKAVFTHYTEDTTPRKKSYSKHDYKIGDLDKAMKELDEALLDMNKNLKIDFSKMDKEMKMAMEEMKKVDWEKMSREVESSLKKVDWEQTKKEVERAMREASVKMKEVDLKQVEKQIAMAKENLASARIHSHIDMDKIKESVEKSLDGARESIDKAKKELAQMKEFTEALEKDGLINRKKGYKIEIKDHELYINGTKQPKETTDKYRKYFKDYDYSLRSDGENITSL